MEKVKVLVTGPVKNDFTSLTSKLSTLQQSKAGPFHVCFCVGPFFGNKSHGDDNKTKNENGKDEGGEKDEQYLQASNFLNKGSPIPIYFCDTGVLPTGIKLPSNEEIVKDKDEIDLDDEDENNVNDQSKHNDENDDTSKQPEIVKIAENVYHLRGISFDSSQTADIVNIILPHDEKNYLTVAFLPPNARIGTPQTSQLEVKTKHPSFVGCDILLTSEWGQGMAGSTCISSQDKSILQQSHNVNQDLNDLGSFDVAEVASLCRPRYHFAPSISTNLSGENGDDSSYKASFFLQSLPYNNPPSALSSGIMKNYHTSRFLALCQVVDSKKAKEGGKAKKFIHALGIQPLWSMDRVTATAIPENSIVAPSPYTDEGYTKDDPNKTGSSGSNNLGNAQNIGLSEAQTRRIIGEENTSDQYRWKINNRKRPLNDSSSQAVDPSNCTLFLHGLHNDVSRGANLNRGIILKAFQANGCTRVRYPGNDRETGINGRLNSYCFLEFPTHDQAAQCLSTSGGVVEISGISLSLRWSSGNNRKQDVRTAPPPPPVGFRGIMMPGDDSDQPMHKRQRVRLTEAEATESSSLFVHFKPNASSPDHYNEAISKLTDLAQNKLEDAINGDGSGERVTAEEEPALKVTSKVLGSKPHCGFLMFASHAAASMALATLTGSTDGGNLLGEFDDQELLHETQLWWGKSNSHENEGHKDSHGHNFQRHHFPLDARTDCWFCLASPTCEKHLIVSLSNYCYITMPKGSVNKNHTLIVPINHSSSETVQRIGAFLDPDPAVVAEIEETKEKIRKHANTKLQKDLLVFERAIPTKRGYHSHVNCIPIDRGLGPKIRSVMLSMAAAPSKFGNGFELNEIQNPDMSVTTILKNSDDIDGYFYAEIPDENNGSKRYLYKYNTSDTSTKFVPLEFGREVLASVLGDPKVASWKENVLTKEQEEEVTMEYRESFES